MKKDIYQEVTNSIIEALEKVSLEDYSAPFAHLTAELSPINPITEKDYHGINTLILWLQQQANGYKSNEWGTFRQWKEKGANVKKGERSSMIIFYKRVEKKDEINNDEPEFYNCLKSYCVFNADQVEGYEPTITRENGNFGTVERIADIETFVASSGAVINEDQNRASFSPTKDHINMPPKDLFFDNGQSATENYYAVLLHELTHWTGGKTRLDREQVGHTTDEKKYAFEELIAELGSAFLCSHFRIKQHGREDHAMYIKSWLQALKNDKKFIFKAASQAQKAVDFLHGLAGR